MYFNTGDLLQATIEQDSADQITLLAPALSTAGAVPVIVKTFLRQVQRREFHLPVRPGGRRREPLGRPGGGRHDGDDHGNRFHGRLKVTRSFGGMYHFPASFVGVSPRPLSLPVRRWSPFLTPPRT